MPVLLTINDLSDSVLERIFSYLVPSSLNSIRLVNKKLDGLIEEKAKSLYNFTTKITVKKTEDSSTIIEIHVKWRNVQHFVTVEKDDLDSKLLKSKVNFLARISSSCKVVVRGELMFKDIDLTKFLSTQASLVEFNITSCLSLVAESFLQLMKDFPVSFRSPGYKVHQFLEEELLVTYRNAFLKTAGKGSFEIHGTRIPLSLEELKRLARRDDLHTVRLNNVQGIRMPGVRQLVQEFLRSEQSKELVLGDPKAFFCIHYDEDEDFVTDEFPAIDYFLEELTKRTRDREQIQVVAHKGIDYHKDDLIVHYTLGNRRVRVIVKPSDTIYIYAEAVEAQIVQSTIEHVDDRGRKRKMQES